VEEALRAEEAAAPSPAPAPASAPAPAPAPAPALAEPAPAPAAGEPAEAVLEEARAEAYERFDKALGDALEAYLNEEPDYEACAERVLREMEVYRGLPGHYPSSEAYHYCAAAFSESLRAEGVRPEIYEDVRRHVTAAIAEGDRSPFWDALRDALRAAGRA